MKMYDCDVCMSAGSVNQWGYCEICGEDFEDPGSFVNWQSLSPAEGQIFRSAEVSETTTVRKLAAVGRDAA